MAESIDPDLSAALANAAFSLFATQQPISDADLAADGWSKRLSMAAASTPDWFSAAATKSSSLVEMAPELRGMEIEQPVPQDRARTDLIRMYGSEETDAEISPSSQSEVSDKVQWSVLKEIADLDD